jgi:hypothetical protein
MPSNEDWRSGPPNSIRCSFSCSCYMIYRNMNVKYVTTWKNVHGLLCIVSSEAQGVKDVGDSI